MTIIVILITFLTDFYFYLVPQLRVEPDYRVTNKGLILECGAKGPPSTATLWSRNGVLLTFTGDDNDQTTGLSSSVDRSGGHYRSRLMLSGVEKGVFSCDVLSDWVATDKRNSGRQSKLFLLYYCPNI